MLGIFGKLPITTNRYPVINRTVAFQGNQNARFASFVTGDFAVFVNADYVGIFGLKRYVPVERFGRLEPDF